MIRRLFEFTNGGYQKKRDSKKNVAKFIFPADQRNRELDKDTNRRLQISK